MEESFFKIEKWTGVGNFSLWAGMMKDKIVARGHDEALAAALPSHMKQEAWDAMRKKVCSYMRLNLSDEVRMEVLHCTTSTELWDYLEKRYLDTSSLKRMYAKVKLWSCV